MKDQEPVIVGIFNITKDQWKQFLEMMDDSKENFSTWERWKIQADQVIMELAGKGVEVMKVEVNLDHFSAWCEKRGRARDGAARSQYAAEILQK